ncbi:MAG: DNA topoisomerase [Kofleriaceae bacterium]
MDLVVAEKPSVARDLARVLGVRPSGQHCFEGSAWTITWCVGHLVQLEEPAAYDARWRAWQLETLPILPREFRLRPSEHATAQLRAVRSLLVDRRFASVVNACDAGREGELIFRYVYEYARARLPVRRLWISSLTEESIRRGFASLRPGAQLEELAAAARSRSEADWLVGMNATRAVTARGRRAGHDALYSIGRVQTPTLAMLVERERARERFVPRDYWEVVGELRVAAGATFSAKWRRGATTRLATRALAEELCARDHRYQDATEEAARPRVAAVRARVVKEPPPLLLDLTSLQRTANRRFGFSAARTLELAQALYERHKVLTYPRTDSRHLSSELVAELPAIWRALAGAPEYAAFAEELLARRPRPGRRVVDDSKVSDHHAIIPTEGAGRAAALATLGRDERRLFDLVARRFLGAFFPDAEIAVTEAWIRVGPGPLPPGASSARAPSPRDVAASRDATSERGGAAGHELLAQLPEPPDLYFARGRVRRVAGWQAVAGVDPGARRAERDGDEGEAGAELPPLVEGQPVRGVFVVRAGQTTPPPRFTEATLLGAMESAGKAIDDEALRAAMKDRGLGTPATRAAVIETLLKRGYATREQQELRPTATGAQLIEALPVASLASPELTGEWEARLARVARGQESRAAFMADIRSYVEDLVAAIRSSPAPAPLAPSRAADGDARPRRGRSRQVRGRPGHLARGTGSRRSAAKPKGQGARAARTSARPASATGRATSTSARPASATGRATSTSARPASAPGRASSTVAIEELGCPRCGQATLMTGSRGWGCSRWREGCRFVIWFETAGRRLTPSQLRELIRRGKTRKARFRGEGGVEIEGRLELDVAADGGVRLARC